MNILILAESAATIELRLILEYVTYAAIIAVGVILLVLLRKCGRLPKHTELLKKLNEYNTDLLRLPEEAKTLSPYRYRKTVAKLVARADKLIYYTAQMAEKERDNDLNSASMSLESARSLLLPLRYEKRESLNADVVNDAADKIRAAANAVSGTLARDAQLKAEREKAKKAKKS